MTTIKVAAIEPGAHIHIGPHDIFRRDLYPVHKDTRERDVIADALVTQDGWTIAVIMWHAGPILGAVVYDRDDTVERAA